MNKKKCSRFQPVIDDPTLEIRNAIQELCKICGRTKVSLATQMLSMGIVAFRNAWQKQQSLIEPISLAPQNQYDKSQNTDCTTE